MNNIWVRKRQPLTAVLFCFTGGNAGGLFAKPTELIVVPMVTGLIGLAIDKQSISNLP